MTKVWTYSTLAIYSLPVFFLLVNYDLFFSSDLALEHHSYRDSLIFSLSLFLSHSMYNTDYTISFSLHALSNSVSPFLSTVIQFLWLYYLKSKSGQTQNGYFLNPCSFPTTYEFFCHWDILFSFQKMNKCNENYLLHDSAMEYGLSVNLLLWMAIAF